MRIGKQTYAHRVEIISLDAESMIIKYIPADGTSTFEGQRYESAGDDRACVLLVESDPEDVRHICGAFEGVSTETSVEVAEDGEAALEFLRTRLEEAAPLPGLVLLDLDLPHADGFDFLDAVRDNDKLVHIPVLVLTDSNDTEDVHESYNRAANAYLSKPTDPDAFETIANAIERFWFRRVSLPRTHL
jgi:CheY-like chemotaxis protein